MSNISNTRLISSMSVMGINWRLIFTTSRIEEKGYFNISPPLRLHDSMRIADPDPKEYEWEDRLELTKPKIT